MLLLGWIALALLLLAIALVAVVVWDRAVALRRLRAGSVVVDTALGPVEYARLGNGPIAVLLLHGGVGGWDQAVALGVDLLAAGAGAIGYDEAVERGDALLPSRYTLIAPSRPGYLRTPVESGPDPDTAADLMAALLETLEVDRVSVVGVSGGGPTSIAFARRHRERVEALVLVAAITGHHVQPQRTLDSLAQPLFWATGGLLLDVPVWLLLRLISLFPRISLRALLAATETFGPDRLRQRTREIIARPAQMVWIRGLVRSLYPPSARKAGLDNDLATYAGLGDPDVEHIDRRTLIVHARHDGNVPFDHASSVAEHLPGAALWVAETCGHLMWASDEAPVMRSVITSFLDQTAAYDPSMSTRPYDTIASVVSASGAREDRMRTVVDALWTHLRGLGVSWVGFYLDVPSEPDDRRLVLGPCRDRPACSPIGMHGACGRALTSGETFIVDDVADLGPNYIACDPRDRSEIVVPLVDGDGTCTAVLDLDSFEPGAFAPHDDAGLRRVLAAAGLGT